MPKGPTSELVSGSIVLQRVAMREDLDKLFRPLNSSHLLLKKFVVLH